MLRLSITNTVNRSVLSILCLIFTVFPVVSALSGLSEGLLGHWALDDDTSDSTGNNPDGIIIGNPTWTEGRFNNALSFVGPKDTVNLGTLNPSEGTGQFSFGLWTNWAGNNTIWQLIFSKRWYQWTDDKIMWSFYLDRATDELLMLSPVNPAIFRVPMVEEGEWAHLAVTYDGTEAILYVDGKEEARDPFKMSSGVDSPLVLSGTVEQKEGYNGIIDHVFLYNRVLDPDEVQKLADGATFEDVLAVKASSKLTTTWGRIKQ
jgi:hypothetical protein